LPLRVASGSRRAEIQERYEGHGRGALQACEAVGGKYVGGWYCFGEYDIVLMADVADNESMTAISLAVAAGGAIKASKTTPLNDGSAGRECHEESNRCSEGLPASYLKTDCGCVEKIVPKWVAIGVCAHLLWHACG
jgi:hypothetical protein